MSLLDAYLATTPGGINTVLVTAFAAAANTSLVFGLQGLRLFVMVLAAPALVRYLLRRSGGRSGTAPTSVDSPQEGTSCVLRTRQG